MVIVLLLLTLSFGVALSRPASTPIYPFRALGSTILDATGDEVQFRCVNWPGHMEANTPEGLQFQPLAEIVKTLAQHPTYNCVRLTYAVELFEKEHMTLRQSFTPGNNNATTDLSPLLRNISTHNPDLVELSLVQVFEAVVDELDKQGLFVLMSNHVSKATWCCSDDDGNGWFNYGYFYANSWLSSLTSMAKVMSSHPNVVALDLRNELRSKIGNDEQITEWMKYMPMGVDAVLAGDATKLVFVSGLSYDTDLSFLNRTDLVSDAWSSQLEEKASNLVFEGHIYTWSPYGDYDGDCSNLHFGEKIGWAWANKRPMVISETGINVDSYSEDDQAWFEGCITSLIVDSRSGYGQWLLGGSYYIRDGALNAHDSFGLLTSDWREFKSEDVVKANEMMDWTK